MSSYSLGKITKMPLFPTEITEMPQFILKYIKNAPILIEITEMPLIYVYELIRDISGGSGGISVRKPIPVLE